MFNYESNYTKTVENRKWFLLGSVSLLAISGLVLLSSHDEYEKFKPVNETTERVYADCDCFGSKGVMESYPPQYNCEG